MTEPRPTPSSKPTRRHSASAERLKLMVDERECSYCHLVIPQGHYARSLFRKEPKPRALYFHAACPRAPRQLKGS